MIQRFVNLVAESSKTGVYSLHRLDVYKHLFHPSRADARVVPFFHPSRADAPVVPFLAGAQGNSSAGGDEQPMLDRLKDLPSAIATWSRSCVVPFLAGSQGNSSAGGDEQPMLHRLKDLPSAIAAWSSSNVDYFSLLGSRGEEGRILCLNKVGAAVLYDPHSDSNFILPSLDKFKGPVRVSVSVAPAGGKEEELYIMHGGGPDGLQLNSDYHFSVLRHGYCFSFPGSSGERWHWKSLPLPPFVDDPQFKPADISGYTVVDGGSTICLSSVADGFGTYYFNTASHEWKHAGDWVLPFTGKAEYISDLNLCLGFSLHSPGYLCAVSDLPDRLMDHKSMSLVVCLDHMPKEWMPENAKLISLGSGKFAVAKVFKAVSNTEEPTVEDEVVVLSGVELEFRGKDNNDLGGLKLFQHKSICYTSASSTAIRYVL